MNDIIDDRSQQVVSSDSYDWLKLQANSTSCFVCGLHNPFGLKLKFYQRSSGEVISDYAVSAVYQGYPGVVHGGVVAAMLDEAAGRAFMGGDSPRFMYTARLDLRFRQNVPVGQPIRLIGRKKTSKERTATASSFIYSSNGSLLAEAEALLIEVPESVTNSFDPDALGWRIYPEEERE
ncbi:MAG: PaaI family thioesterase [Anaerolineales bacterium]